MTLPELFGVVLGLLVALVSVVTVLVLGHGVWVALGALVAGAITGWVLGAALSRPVEQAIARREKRHRDDLSADD